MKQKIYNVLTVNDRNGTMIDEIYSYFIMLCVVVSILPLMFKQSYWIFGITETILLFVFLADYLLQWFVADIQLKQGRKSYLMYPFTFLAIIDLISILPFFRFISSSFGVLRLLRLARILRVLKLLRYSKNYILLSAVFRNEKKHLISVIYLAVGYILLSALVMFSVESKSFNHFYDAIYWSTTALTTVGYGDLYPVSALGKLVSMVSSLFGIAIVAIPSGIITAGYLKEMTKEEQ